MLPQLTAEGYLPLGRWPATMQEVKERFATPQGVRTEIWDDYLRLLEALREAVEVPAVWLSGSFFSAKSLPGDLDCVFHIEANQLPTVGSDPLKVSLLNIVANNETKPMLDLKLDTFVLVRDVTAGPGLSDERYLSTRGYWDDLWSRVKSTDPRQDVLPRRGYLEVIVDGFK